MGRQTVGKAIPETAVLGGGAWAFRRAPHSSVVCAHVRRLLDSRVPCPHLLDVALGEEVRLAKVRT